MSVGALTDPDPSSSIDCKETNKGVLPNRVALTGTNDAATITSPATGLLIYNTATAGTAPNDVVPGYYYNSGTPITPNWSRFNISKDTLDWTKVTTATTTASKTDNQYVTGDVGIGDFSGSSPSHKLHVKGGIRTESGFIANDGTAGTPSYRFNSQGTLGMYKVTTDVLGFATASTERIRIDAVGNVGIGNTNPSEKLDVKDGNIKLTTTTTATSTNGQLQFQAGGEGSTTKMVVVRKTLSITTSNTTPTKIFDDGYMRFGVWFGSGTSRWTLGFSPYNNQYYDYNYIGNARYYNGSYYYTIVGINNYEWCLSDDITTTSGTYYECGSALNTSGYNYGTGGNGMLYAEATTNSPFYEFSFFITYTSTSTQRILTVVIKAYY